MFRRAIGPWWRPWRAWCAPLVLLVCLCVPSRAQKTSEPLPPLSLVSAGASYRFERRLVPLPHSLLGPRALALLDGTAVPVTEPASPPPGWPAEGLARAAGPLLAGPAPLGSRDGDEGCDCLSEWSDSLRERVQVVYLDHVFALPTPLAQAQADYQLLQLRTAYRDGIRVYLNGELIAARNLGPTDGAATGRRGPEWEEFLVPLRAGLLRQTGNVLAIELRPSEHIHGVRFDAEASLLRAQRHLRGPMVQQVQGDRALVMFDTELPSRARVDYGFTEELGSSALSADGALARHHRVRLTGLAPGKKVYYRVQSDAAVSELLSFHVPPPAEEPLHFAVYGDMRGGHRVHAKIVASLLRESIDFVVVTGDLVLRGSDEADWQRFFAVAEPLLARIAYYPVVGNHDMGKSGDERRRMRELFALWPGPKDRPVWGTWYSFDISGVHFVMLDSNSYRSEEQLRWLEADLQAAKSARAIFAAVHAGPYSRGPHGGHSFAAEHYAPLLRAHGVSLLFAGHDHLFQRGQVEGLPYMVSGGGGAPLYPVSCGVRGRKRCESDDGMESVERAYHYILVSVFPDAVQACPKREDGSALETCTRYPLAR